ncbi:hypothetical protein [Microseira wollei]|uniref:Prevent-host-death protein n=1 Tax=Microseira wollei NIES-4236 TaxID=2530354 RepID=A0AAV3XJS4_9CYAN|nr:hypothetical protein [Microseira wollei]GET42908.1 hypothetical protein MiSe_77260 [Microseira wollei NIES-4236]
MNVEQSIAVESLRNISVEEFLNLLRQKSALAVEFPNGESLIVQAVELAPLPILDGYVPEGWKEGIYEH